MASEDVEVVGADRLASTLGEYARSIADMTDANRRAGELVATAARIRAPRRTGRLASSVRVDVSPKSADVSFGVVYAAPIHWGVGPRIGLRGPHNIAATLFLTNALSAQEEAVSDVYASVLDKRLGMVQGA